MPAIKGIDLSEGIKILHNHKDDVFLPKAGCVVGIGETLEEFNAKITSVVQTQYEYSWDLKDPSWKGDLGRIGGKNPILLPNERIEKIGGTTYYIVTEMFVSIHFDAYQPVVFPPKIRCSNPECGYKVCPNCGLINEGTAWIELPLKLVDSVSSCSCSCDLTSVAFIGGIGGEWWLDESLSIPLPNPFEGRLFQSCGGMIGEFDDVIAVPYRSYQDYKNYLYVVTDGEAKDYLLPTSDGMNSSYVSAIMTARDEIWIAFSVPITINQYRIGEDAVSLVSSTTLGDSKSLLKDLIRLDSGKLFVVWHQFERDKVDAEGNLGIDVGFAYRTLDGNWHTLPYTWVFPFGIPATQGTVCQHPADGSIWFFCQPDSRGITCVIHLIESDGGIVVDWTDYNFLNKDDGAMAPEGELPFFSAIADKVYKTIVLAYQSRAMQIFSTDPFCKGAKPVVIQVNADGSKSPLFVLDKWVERINPLYIGLTDQNEVWLFYGQIDEVNLTWNDLYISTETKDKYCGKLQYGIPSNAGVRFCNSSRMVVATMDDSYIHFFRVGEWWL